MNISKNTGLLVTVIDGEEEVELMLCAFTRWPGLSCLHDFRLGAVEIRGIFVDGLRLSVSPLAARTRNEFCIQLDNGPFVWQTVLDGSLLENEHDHTLRLTQQNGEIMELCKIDHSKRPFYFRLDLSRELKHARSTSIVW